MTLESDFVDASVAATVHPAHHNALATAANSAVYDSSVTVDSVISAASGGRARGLRDFISVKDSGAKGDGSTDDTAAIQYALANAATDTVFFPPGTYVVSGTIYVQSDRKIYGAGDNYGGTRISNTTDATVFYCQSNATAGGSKIHTRVIIDGIKFYKNSPFSSTQFVIDMIDGSMNEITGCSFGDNTNGCLNALDMDGTAHWISRCRFLGIGLSSSSGLNAAIRGSTGSGAVVDKCQFERTSSILLSDCIGWTITGCHIEESKIILRNSRGCVIRDSLVVSTLFVFDNKSNRCRMENVRGTCNRLVNWGMNRFDRVNASYFARDLFTLDFSPEFSPVVPISVGTEWNSTYQQAWGTSSQYLLFVIEATNPTNHTNTTDTVALINTATGTAAWTSPSITLNAGNPTGDQPQDSSIDTESFTFWAFVQVPSGGHLAIQSSFKCCAWVGQAVSGNPLATSTLDWGGSDDSGFYSSYVGNVPTTVGGHLTMTPPSAASFSVIQYMPFPPVPPRSYLLFLVGTWAEDQTIILSNTAAHDGSDNAGVSTSYVNGDSTYDLQSTGSNHQLMLAASEMPTSNHLQISIGGYTQTDLSPITALAAALIPLN